MRVALARHLSRLELTRPLRSRVVGSTERWLEVNNRDLHVGSFFDDAQVRSAARVVVVGPTVAETLFGDAASALGKTIRINHQDFRVVGVMQSAGQPGDNDVAMPLNAARRYIFGGGDIESIVLAGLGGLIGVGVGLSYLGATVAHAFGPTIGTFAPAVTIPSVALSFGISLVIGLVAGGYPANRAARLRPVEALRYE
ncbi:MAG: ABC transporter permease [Pseudonocardiaceae bacterium]